MPSDFFSQLTAPGVQALLWRGNPSVSRKNQCPNERCGHKDSVYCSFFNDHTTLLLRLMSLARLASKGLAVNAKRGTSAPIVRVNTFMQLATIDLVLARLWAWRDATA